MKFQFAFKKLKALFIKLNGSIINLNYHFLQMSKAEKETKKEKTPKDEEKKTKTAKATKTKNTKSKSSTKKNTSAKKVVKKFSWVDCPDEPPLQSKYVHKSVQLDKKHPEFTMTQFQNTRHSQLCKTVVYSFHHIGVCLNDIDVKQLPKKGVDKAIFILINSHNNVGCFNDAYLLSLIHRKLEFNIAFLINPDLVTFFKYLNYFLTHTWKDLTIYYSGTDAKSKIRKRGHGIKFMDQTFLSAEEFGQIVGQKSNGKAFVLILQDCENGGSIFNMSEAIRIKNVHCSDIVSFTSHKSKLSPGEKIKSHGLFTYYFSRLIRQFPTSSPKDMVEKLNEAMQRFKITYSFETSCDDDRVAKDILFEDADLCMNGPTAEITGPSKRERIIIQREQHTTEAIPAQFQQS